MITSINSFLKEWQYESSATVTLLEKLTDDSLSWEAYPGGRTLGRLANHILEAVTELPSKLKLGIEEQHPAFKTASEIVEQYKKDSENLVNAIREKWTDANLTDRNMMYGGEEWPNGVSLNVLIKHQCHHRGQLTMLMRQAGLVIPGIYGPAREEWAAIGMQALD